MSFDRSSAPGRPRTQDASEALSPSVGKQTLTSQLDAPVQQRAGTITATTDVHDAAAHGTSGPTTGLPHLEQIQRSFGRHDVGHTRAHVDGNAAEGAGAMGADAFAMGDHVAFAGAPDLHTAAHEAAHVVQQRGGVQLKGGVGEVGDAYEQHADAVADLVVQGKSSEALLERHAGAPGAAAGPGAVQRHAFVGGKQIKKSDPVATGDVAALVTDDVVRSYDSKDELKQHAARQTDYLGNLPDGTWLRFSPTGTNLLGENHTVVTLQMVAPAVGSKSFIYEPFANDDLADGSHLKTAYETQNAERFKALGIDGEKDKKQFGAESLIPKIGFGLGLALPYLRDAGKLSNLTKASGVYDGQPIQGAVKFGWAWAQDIKAQVEQQRKAKQAVLPKQAELCKVVTAVEGDLDAFITGLPVRGWLGDAFIDNGNTALLPKLLAFATATIDALVEQAVADPSSRMDDAKKQKFGGSTTEDEKQAMFGDWRNFKFEDSVKDAAKRGVRYAGMGAAHLYHLQDVGLPSNGHAFDMSGPDLDTFEKHTAKLKKRAVKQ
jgi:hypothetical protein